MSWKTISIYRWFNLMSLCYLSHIHAHLYYLSSMTFIRRHTSIHLSTSIHQFIYQSIHHSIHPSIHPFSCPSIYPFIRPSTHPPINLPTNLSIHPTINSPIHPLTYWIPDASKPVGNEYEHDDEQHENWCPVLDVGVHVAAHPGDPE